MGIEPTSSAWKAEVLPLNYTRQHSQADTNRVGKRVFHRRTYVHHSCYFSRRIVFFAGACELSISAFRTAVSYLFTTTR